MFPSPGWGELIERQENIRITKVISCIHGFHPQVGESWSKDSTEDDTLLAGLSSFPSPGWGELIESMDNEKTAQDFQRFHPQVGESWSKEVEYQKEHPDETMLFPSPGWGELIERKTTKPKSRKLQNRFHPQVGESWSKGYLQKRQLLRKKESFHPQVGESWSKDEDGTRRIKSLLQSFHPQVGESWSKVSIVTI